MMSLLFRIYLLTLDCIFKCKYSEESEMMFTNLHVNDYTYVCIYFMENMLEKLRL